MRKINVFLMLICLLFVFSGCDNPTGNNKKSQVFTGTLGVSLWSYEHECWILGFDTKGDNNFVLKIEVGFKDDGIAFWYEPKNWVHVLEENELAILIFPCDELPIVKMGYDYKITITY